MAQLPRRPDFLLVPPMHLNLVPREQPHPTHMVGLDLFYPSVHVGFGGSLHGQDAWVVRMDGDQVDKPEQVLPDLRETIPVFRNRYGIPFCL